MSAPGPATSVTGVMTSAEAIAWVEAARGPEDLFGADAARAYRRLAQLTHPDTCPGDGRAAGRAPGCTAAGTRGCCTRPCCGRAVRTRSDERARADWP